jgi:hypothetical protein
MRQEEYREIDGVKRERGKVKRERQRREWGLRDMKM